MEKPTVSTASRSCVPVWRIVAWQEGLDTSKAGRDAVTEFPHRQRPGGLRIVRQRPVARDHRSQEGSGKIGKMCWSRPSDTPKAHFRSPGIGAALPGAVSLRHQRRNHHNTGCPAGKTHLATNRQFSHGISKGTFFDATPAHNWLLDTPPERITRLRPYQISAITATEAAIRSGRARITSWLWLLALQDVP